MRVSTARALPLEWGAAVATTTPDAARELQEHNNRTDCPDSLRQVLNCF